MIATSPGTPPIGDGGDGEEDDDEGDMVEVGKFTRFVGLVLNFRRDGVEELLIICVTGLDGLGFKVTL